MGSFYRSDTEHLMKKVGVLARGRFRVDGTREKIVLEALTVVRLYLHNILFLDIPSS